MSLQPPRRAESSASTRIQVFAPLIGARRPGWPAGQDYASMTLRNAIGLTLSVTKIDCAAGACRAECLAISASRTSGRPAISCAPRHPAAARPDILIQDHGEPVTAEARHYYRENTVRYMSVIV